MKKGKASLYAVMVIETKKRDFWILNLCLEKGG